jgi:hypothetical protein
MPLELRLPLQQTTKLSFVLLTGTFVIAGTGRTVRCLFWDRPKGHRGQYNQKRTRKPRSSLLSLSMALVSAAYPWGARSDVQIVTALRSAFFHRKSSFDLRLCMSRHTYEGGIHSFLLYLARVRSWYQPTWRKMRKFHYGDGPESMGFGCSQLSALSSCLATQRRAYPK